MSSSLSRLKKVLDDIRQDKITVRKVRFGISCSYIFK